MKSSDILNPVRLKLRPPKLWHRGRTWWAKTDRTFPYGRLLLIAKDVKLSTESISLRLDLLRAGALTMGFPMRWKINYENPISGFPRTHNRENP